MNNLLHPDQFQEFQPFPSALQLRQQLTQTKPAIYQRLNELRELYFTLGKNPESGRFIMQETQRLEAEMQHTRDYMKHIYAEMDLNDQEDKDLQLIFSIDKLDGAFVARSLDLTERIKNDYPQNSKKLNELKDRYVALFNEMKELHRPPTVKTAPGGAPIEGE